MKKQTRFTAVLLAFALLLLSLFGSSVPVTAEELPLADVEISSAEELLLLSQRAGRDSMEGLTVVLSNDIDMAGEAWTPIGTSLDVPFSGTFDGCGHTIKNLKAICDSTGYAGLFGNLKRATVKNVRIENCDLQGTDGSSNVIGVIAGYSLDSAIEGCLVTGGIIGGNYGNIGGIVGAASGGSVTGCHVRAELWGSCLVGGIMGTGSAAISGCSAEVEITCVAGETGGTAGFGGIAGFAEASIADCFSLGSISAQGAIDGVAGIAGYSWGPIERCYSAAVILRNGGPANSQFTAGLAAYLGGDSGSIAVLKDSVALNPTISVQNDADCETLGRVAAFCGEPYSDQLENNYAWSGMRIGVSGEEAVTEPGTSQQSIHGGDVTAEALCTMDFWTGLGFDFVKGPWKWETGKLPYLEGTSAREWPQWLAAEEEPVRPEPTPVPSTTPRPTPTPTPKPTSSPTIAPTSTPVPDGDKRLFLSTAEDLKAFAAYWMQYSAAGVKEVYLDHDIDLEGEALAKATLTNVVFDGQGHTVSNLGSSLFDFLNASTVRNVRLENFSISNGAGSQGGIANSAAASTIENCHVTGAITMASKEYNCRAGGIVGSTGIGVLIRRCSANVVLEHQADSAGAHLGGIVGEGKPDTMIENCYTTGSITGYSENHLSAGGLAGAYASAKNSYSTMALRCDVKRKINRISGLVGCKNKEIIIENCVALNPYLLYENGTFVSRVLAEYTPNPDKYTSTDYLKNNYGWAGMRMKKPHVAAYSFYNNHETLNGQDIYTKEIADKNVWETQIGFSFEEDLWQWEEGKLPYLKGGVALEWPDWLGDYIIECGGSFLTVAKGTPYEELLLPETVSVCLGSGKSVQVPVIWRRDDSFDGNTNGKYTISGELVLPEGIENPWGLSASLTISVIDEFYVWRVRVVSLYAPVGTAYENLDLPETVEVELNAKGKIVEIPVEWNAEGYDPAQTSSQFLQGVLVDLPENISNPDHRAARAFIKRQPTVTPTPTPTPTPVPGTYTVKSGVSSTVTVEIGMPVEDLSLPKTQPVVRSDDQKVSLPVAWTDFSRYDPDACGRYSIFGEYTEYPENLRNPQNIKPMVTIAVINDFTIGSTKAVRLEVGLGTPFEELPLPDTVSAVRLEDGKVVTLPVKWIYPGESIRPYDPDIPGLYLIRGEFQEYPDNLTNPNGKRAAALIRVLEPAVTPTPSPVPESYTIKNGINNGITVEIGTPIEQLSLPEDAVVVRNDGQKVSLPVIWDDFSKYDPDTCGRYSIFGKYTEYPEDLSNPQNIKPEITVEVRKDFTIATGKVVQLEVEFGIPFEELPLPDTVGAVRLEDGKDIMLPVKWLYPDGDTYRYNPNQAGGYFIQGEYLKYPDTLTNPDDRRPVAYVIVKKAAAAAPSPAPPQGPVGPSEENGPIEAVPPVVTEDGAVRVVKTAADGTVTTTTAWPDGRKVEAVRAPNGNQTITVTSSVGETMVRLRLPAEPGAGKKFEDVREGAWYQSAVSKAAAYSLFSGTGESVFSPNASMTRGMLTQVLYSLSGNPPYGVGGGAFADVASGSYYENAVGWAARTGVTSGTGAAEFSPNTSVTREQLITMLYRYADMIGAADENRASLDRFPDAGQVSKYAREAMSWAVSEGLLFGRENGGKSCLAPQSTTTRAEAAAVLVRFVEKLKK